jgi:hypothetical protein
MGAMASAQLLELKSTRDGSGSINYRSRSGAFSVGRAKVSLDRNGTGEIQLSNGSDELFRGTWRNLDSRTVHFEINRLVNDYATGSGRIVHDGRGEVVEINLNGEGRGRSFSFSFSARRTPDRPTSVGRYLMRSEREGQGTARFNDSRTSTNRLNRVLLVLERDGHFQVFVRDGASANVEGTYREVGRNELALDVERWDGRRASGRGRIILDTRESYDSIELDAQDNRSTLRFSFTTGRTVVNRPPSMPDREARRFIDNARAGIVDRFPRRARIDFDSETVGDVTFGERTVKGYFTVRGTDQDGRYKFSVTLGAGTANVKGISYSRV